MSLIRGLELLDFDNRGSTSACILMPMSSRFFGSILLACLFSASDVLAQEQSATRSVQTSTALPQIPSPSGPFGIGRIGYHWIDTSRSDDYDPKRKRELMVYFWYAGAKGQYFPGAAQMDALPEIHELMTREFRPYLGSHCFGRDFVARNRPRARRQQPHAFPGCHFLSRARQQWVPIHSAHRTSGESWICSSQH